MKTLLLLLVCLPSIASAQVFRSVSWGMSPSEVAAIEGRDISAPFADTAFGRPAAIMYWFGTDGGLRQIDVDLTRPHDVATPEIADSTLVDVRAVKDALSARFGYLGPVVSFYRPENRNGPNELLGGYLHWEIAWTDSATAAYQVADGISGRVVHVVTFRALDVSAVESDDVRSPALDLR